MIFWLKLKFYSIVKHRYRCKLGEIDLIAKKGDRLVFIEVKTSLRQKIIPLSSKQCQSIIRVAKYFIATNNKFASYSMSFDLYFLSLRNGFLHISDAWQE